MSILRSNPRGNFLTRRRPDAPMEDQELASFLHGKIETAMNRDEGDISRVRKQANDDYRGVPENVRAGHSAYQTREVFDTVEWAMPSIMSTFFSTHPPIKFEPQGIEDVEAAQQATDVVNYFLFGRTNSFIEFHHWFKAAMLYPNSYAKVHASYPKRTRFHRYDSLTPQQLTLLRDTKKWKKGSVDVFDNGDGTFRMRGFEIVRTAEYRFEAVPPEQLLVDEDAVDLDLDEVFSRGHFICHRLEMTFDELVTNYPEREEEITRSGGDSSSAVIRSDSERVNRRGRFHDQSTLGTQNTDYAGQGYTVYECYVAVDIDGDGKQQTRKIVLLGDLILENEPCEYQPFVVLAAIPMPYEHVGLSFAEALREQQRVGTALTRQVLDNIYQMNVRRRIVSKDALMPNKWTLDQFKNAAESTIVVKGRPAEGVMYEQVEMVTDKIMPLLLYMDDKTKKRTGVAPENALNPDVLRDATAHGMLIGSNAQTQRIMHLVRIFAETGVKKVAYKMYTLLRMHQDVPLTLRLRGKWHEVDPAGWADRTDLKVRVGLGFNSRQEAIAALAQVLGLQKEGLGTGMSSAQHIAHTLEEMVESSELGFYGEYFVDPREPGWQPPPPAPDPQMEAIKAQKEIEMAKDQTKKLEIQAKNQEHQLDKVIEKGRLNLDQQKAAGDADLAFEKLLRESFMFQEHRLAEIENMTSVTELNRAKIRSEMAQSSDVVREAKLEKKAAKTAKDEGSS